MFNFLVDSSAVSVQEAGFDRNASTPSWTVLFDSKTWVLIVP